jgi:hypothetical protein
MMMDARELRIGNLAQMPHTKTPVTITLNDFARAREFDTHFRGYEPIPLTDEWFERFDYDRTDWRFTYDISLNAYTLERKYNGFDSSEWIWISNIRFIHEWQNLYPLLTGKELTIKTETKLKAHVQADK